MKISPIEVKLIDSMGSDLSCVNAARVSFEKESFLIDDDENGIARLSDGDRKLISYLAKHKHFSPFNHAFMSFRVKAPIFVARQLVKHKFMPWNEVSRRYVDSEPEFFFPPYWRAKADNVKQGSEDKPMEDKFISLGFTEAVERSYMEYSHMIKYEGVCPEMARMVLPLNTMTEWIWSGTLNAFCDMLRLRLDKHSQYESRVVANLIAQEVKNLFPVSYNALLEGAE